MARILVVDDEKSIRISVSEFLKDDGHDVKLAEDTITALDLLKKNDFDVVVTDIILPKMSGVKLLEAIREVSEHVQVIMITGEPTIETASMALRLGAFDYLAKPVTKENILKTVNNAANKKVLLDDKLRLEAENLNYQANLERLVDERTRELLISEKKFRDISDLLPEIIYEMDIDGNITYVNKVTFEKTGYSENEFKEGIKVSQFLAPEERERAGKNIAKIMKGEVLGANEYSLQRKDGSIYHAFIHSSLIIRDDKPVGMRGTIVDITERKRAEKALIEGEARFRSVLETAYDSIVSIDKHGKFIFINEATQRMFGYSTGELAGKSITEIVPEQYREAHLKGIERVASGGEQKLIGKTVELAGLRKGGSEFPIDLSLSKGETDEGIFFTGIIRDITERKTAEAALIRSEEKFRNFAEQLVDVLFVADQAGISYISPSALTLFGYEQQHLIGQNFASLFADLETSKKLQPVEMMLASGSQANIEVTMQRKDGTTFEGEIHSKVYTRTDGWNTIVGIIRDITERKQAENAIRESEERYHKFFEEDLTGDYLSTPAGELIDCNLAFVSMFGFSSKEEAMLTSMQSLYPIHSDRDVFLARLTKEKKLKNLEQSLRLQDGKTIHVIENTIGIFNETGELVQIKGYIFDITEQKSLEEQVRQAVKMETVGRLAGGVAHDFNNLLTVISGHADLAMMQVKPEDPLYEHLNPILEASDRAAGLTRQLLAFSRKQVLEPKIINLKSVVSNLQKMLGRLIGEDVKFTVSSASDLWNIKADPGQIEQVIINLSTNARDAMPDGGKLTIETRNVDIDEDQRKEYQDLSAGDYVLLTVTDTGCGMPKDIIDKIFEPFFTTKETGKGTGLGLSTVFGIVRQSEGFIYVDSEVGKGSTFSVYFPRINEVATVNDGSSNVGSLNVRCWETILLIEDEDVVRKIAHSVLKGAGYKVIETKSGDEALQYCKTLEKPVDLVLTDVVMPGLNGVDFVVQLRQMWPGVKALLMSGYTADAISRHGVFESGTHFLKKPFRAMELLKKVRETLGNPNTPPVK